MYDFKAFSFGYGKHATRDEGMCVMEAAAYLAGESHSDHPACASPVITELAIWLNDSLDDDRRREWLAGLPYRLVGTAACRDIEQQRAFMAADWAVRFACPIMLDRAGLTAEAQFLSDLPTVDSENAAADAARAAARAADAAAYAARGAAYAARAADDLEVIQRGCLDLIDRMVRLTEIQEVVPVSANESVAV